MCYAANQLAHRYGFGCEADGRNLLEDPVAAVLKIDQAWLDATDVKAPGAVRSGEADPELTVSDE